MMQSIDLAELLAGKREISTAWQNAKVESAQIKRIDHRVLESLRDDRGRDVGPAICSTMDFLKNRLAGGCDTLSKRKFTLNYDLRGNLDRQAMYAAECVNLSFQIRWKRSPVKASFVNRALKDVMINSDAASFIRQSYVRDISKFAKAVGFSTSDAKQLDGVKVDSVLKLFSVGAAGQNKISRLVKGCLIMLDFLESGGRDVEMPQFHTIDYTLEGLCSHLTQANNSYVFTSAGEDVRYTHFIAAMCEEYPNPTLGGLDHVKIPRDGKYIHVVGWRVRSRVTEVYYTPMMIQRYLMKYCEDMGLGEDLESALVIACSLRENRYLTEVRLPKVVSGVDLIWPATVQSNVGVGTKSIITEASATVIGRVHQMLCLILFKDFDTSIRNTSLSHRNQGENIRSYLNRDSLPLTTYMSDKTCAELLRVSGSMEWLKCLTDQGVQHIRGFSAFEGFWLVRYPKTALEQGIIHHFKCGNTNPIVLQTPGLYVDSFNMVQYEARLAGVDVVFTIPAGKFNIKLSCIQGACESPKEIEFDNEGDDKLTMDCHKVIGDYKTMEFYVGRTEMVPGPGWKECSTEEESDGEDDEEDDGEYEDEGYGGDEPKDDVGDEEDGGGQGGGNANQGPSGGSQHPSGMDLDMDLNDWDYEKTVLPDGRMQVTLTQKKKAQNVVVLRQPRQRVLKSALKKTNSVPPRSDIPPVNPVNAGGVVIEEIIKNVVIDLTPEQIARRKTRTAKYQQKR